MGQLSTEGSQGLAMFENLTANLRARLKAQFSIDALTFAPSCIQGQITNRVRSE